MVPGCFDPNSFHPPHVGKSSRAPLKASVECSVLDRWFGWLEQRGTTAGSLICLQDICQMLVAKPSILTALQSKRASFNQRIVDQPWKLTLWLSSCNVGFAGLNLFRLGLT